MNRYTNSPENGDKRVQSDIFRKTGFQAKKLLKTVLFLAIAFPASSQIADRAYFSPPVKIPIFLAGNFGELRPNHFHAGIDIKTQGRTGIPVYAAADGYVARISVSATGYGNALYINHPNGTTTVYGHLKSFTKPIQDYIRDIQYEKESFAVDQTVPEEMFPVKKGEMIALSGNTGGSAGPHLHFEIRDTKEEKVLNPLKYQFPIKDQTPPAIQSLVVYPVAAESSVAGKQTEQRFLTVKAGKSYQLKDNQVIPVYGEIGFGLQTVDLLDGTPNRCSIYSMKLEVDNRVIYAFNMDNFFQNETKYVNAHMDYALAVLKKIRLYRAWVLPGDRLHIYNSVVKRGIFDATDGKIHQVSFEIADAYGNETSLSFKIQSKHFEVKEPQPRGELFRYNHNNRIRTDDLDFSIPEGALYDDVDFVYMEKPALPRFFSPVYRLDDSTVPLHFACPLRIRATNLPERLQSKVMLAQIDPVSGKVYSATGKYNDGWVEGNIRVLGDYTLAVDTIPPKIIPVPEYGKDKKPIYNTLKFRITDYLSGIENYRGTIDGKWVLFEYDLKNNLITYTFDTSRIQSGKKHELSLEVTDFKGNTSTYQTTFVK